MPWTFALMLIATLAIAGVPPFSGFFSKDEILAAAFARGQTDPIYLVAWGLGVLAALMTAYYMARLMAMTFLGKFRGGTAAEPHLHEAPWTMTGPLVVLGSLSAIGGVINLPEFLGTGTAQGLDHWLEPVTAPALALMPALVMPHGSVEVMLLLGAIAVALFGLTLGLRVTMASLIPTPQQAAPEQGLWLLLNRKYYIDELYAAVIVRPLVWLSRRVLWQIIDAFLVDRVAVGGTARIATGLGWLGSRVQNGQIAFYVVMFAAGAVLILRTLLR
jgi:NADH-quinone oxidoreductase subunit L